MYMSWLPYLFAFSFFGLLVYMAYDINNINKH